MDGEHFVKLVLRYIKKHGDNHESAIADGMLGELEEEYRLAHPAPVVVEPPPVEPPPVEPPPVEPPIEPPAEVPQELPDMTQVEAQVEGE